ncbi:hypothetical protein, partial [Agarivorans sp.]|uniref:hypothetical protein n=1 Tax=Agarivorans sp. TaxID=1872412 RepID=UPI003D06CFAD
LIRREQFNLNNISVQQVVTNSPLSAGYKLPEYDHETANNSIDGYDNNQNGLRDDFEVFVIMDNKPEFHQLGLQAGQLFQQILSLRNKQVSATTRQEAADLLNKSVYLRMCVAKLNQQDPTFVGFQHRYINTVDRVRAYREAQRILRFHLGDSYMPISQTEPCTSFNQQMSRL